MNNQDKKERKDQAKSKVSESRPKTVISEKERHKGKMDKAENKAQGTLSNREAKTKDTNQFLIRSRMNITKQKHRLSRQCYFSRLSYGILTSFFLIYLPMQPNPSVYAQSINVN